MQYAKNSIILLLFLSTNFVFAQKTAANIKNIKKHISYLASDELRGRAPGTEGEEKAAAYIEKYFKKYDLIPKGSAKSDAKSDAYEQPFDYKQNDNPHGEATEGTARNGKNIVGFLDNGAENTIVIGAHYDHLGDDGRGSSLDANPKGHIHNGADDNASGVAGVLELARIYSTNGKKEPYNFLFIAFSAEEAGLIGSKYFTNHPTIDLQKVQLMMNMDMVGRLNDSTMKLMIYGVGSSPIFVPMLSNFQTKPFHIVTDSSGVGPSDHTSFYLKNVPVLHFFTGQHSDYHKPSDDVEKINFKGEAQVLDFMQQLIGLFLESPKLSFRETKVPTSKSGGFKISMGIMPDYAFDGEGVRVDGVTDGKPAQKAGILRDDIIIHLGKTVCKDIYKYMDALNQCKKGETTTVKIKRKGVEKELQVTF